MTAEIAMRVSGVLYLTILALWLASAILGYSAQFDDYDADAELRKIGKNPKKWRTGVASALIAHVCVVALAVTLFMAFGSHSLLLGVIWMTFRVGEGLVQIYGEKDYGGLQPIAGRYAVASGVEKTALGDLTRTILRTKDRRFKVSQLFWGVGTLALSIVLVAYAVAPLLIGWMGVVAGILGISYNGLSLARFNVQQLMAFGGLFGIIFEVSVGVWLVVS